MSRGHDKTIHLNGSCSDWMKRSRDSRIMNGWGEYETAKTRKAFGTTKKKCESEDPVACENDEKYKSV